ncbi:hypothetical protein KTT_40800 [Tengunoibacter tsumagoiensis]|uniref:Uncharacterized protein n=1 Tax=Tengunoibacter tsumagoiensis TaxID=2014871 RepID=A0A402A4T2_9CHLR|nr:hypothetical protein KTT_40260 [Tengunoibacter tsumagoiensis]GCE14221.1 hypothetical protein KTT_40800 [Tengunoibacter tsumagoiensis]
MRRWNRGDKVYAKINQQKVAAVVLQSRDCSAGDYELVQIKTAEKNHLSGQWVCGSYPKPVQSYKLTLRRDVIPGFDAK